VLRRSAAGCRWLKTHWVALRERLARYGIMTEVDVNSLLHLDGTFACEGDSATFSIAPQVCETVYLAAGTWPTKAPFGQTWLREVPAAVMEQYKAQWPTPQAHRDELLRRIDDGIAELDARIAELEADEEAEVEDEALDAMVLCDPKEADLHLRYAKEADTALTKALNAFWALQEREAAGEAATADAADVAAADESAAAASPPPEGQSGAPTAEAVPDSSPALPESVDQEVAEAVESLVAITAGLAPEEAWDFVQKSLAVLPAGEVREATLAAARFRNDPGARIVGSQAEANQGSYVPSSGYHPAVLAGLREVARGLGVMAPSGSLADPPVQH
jgi:hypothetical protein